MTLDELKAHLLRTARTMQGWCLAMLRERESRTDQEIVNIARAIQIDAFEASFVSEEPNLIDDCYVFMWDSFMEESVRWGDDASRLEKDLKITCTPTLQSAEAALVIGLILSEASVAHLQSQSHAKHLLAANLLVSATEAAEYWRSIRGLTGCRVPDAKWVNAYRVISEKEVDRNMRQRLRLIARSATNAKHSKPGGSREKRTRIREKWATGNYSSRDICAEQECGAIGMSFSTARKALRNTPEPPNRPKVLASRSEVEASRS